MSDNLRNELNTLLDFIDGERIIGADTKEEQINGQGQNQAYDNVENYVKKVLKELR